MDIFNETNVKRILKEEKQLREKIEYNKVFNNIEADEAAFMLQSKHTAYNRIKI